MNANRSAGCPGSSGKYVPPDFTTPNNATNTSTPDPTHTPTTDSQPTPRPRNNHANRFARAFNSPNDTPPPSTPPTATAPDPRTTAPSNNSPNVTHGTSIPVSFHPRTNKSRSAAGRTSSSDRRTRE